MPIVHKAKSAAFMVGKRERKKEGRKNLLLEEAPLSGFIAYSPPLRKMVVPVSTSRGYQEGPLK